MKKLIFALLIFLILCFNSYALIVGYSRVANGGGGTPTIIAQQLPITTTERSLSDWSLGMSFISTADPLYSISLYISASGAQPAGTIICRIGTTSDLTTVYTEEFTIAYGGGTDEWVEILSATQPTLTAGTWYFACQSSSAINVQIEDGANANYTDGAYHYVSYPAWNTSEISTRDTVFRVKVLQ